MFFPQGAAIEGLIDRFALIHVVKASDPGEDVPVFAFQKVAEDDGSQLFKGLREIALEITSELIALSFFDRIAAELNHLKIFQMLNSARSKGRFVIAILVGHSAYQGA